MKLPLLVILVYSVLAANGQDEFTSACNKFAIKTYQDLKPGSGNILLSPISINIALAMILEGATGETKTNLQELLHLNSTSDFTGHYRELLTTLPFQNSQSYRECIKIEKEMGRAVGDNQFNIHNAVWYQNNVEIKPAYLKTLETNYQVESFDVNKSEIPLANTQISDWIRKKTNGKIQSSNAHMDEQTPMVLVNAVYLLAQWERVFEDQKTKQKNFFTGTGEKVKKDFMNGKFSLLYHENKNLQVIKIPYQCNLVSFLLVPPQKKMGLYEVESTFSENEFSSWLAQMKWESVMLSMPKFRIESMFELTTWLDEQNTFSEKGTFSGIFPGDSSWAPVITHQTFIETDEEKTEAAALTEIVITGYGGGKIQPIVPKIVDADHPFLFFILDETTGLITFIGRLDK